MKTNKMITLLIVCFLFSAVLSVEAAAQPPYKARQLVVKGSPDSLSGYNVLKYLPNANLTILSVLPGQELAEVQKLRARGYKASLNLIAQKSATVNDPYYSYQWHFSHIQSEQAWDLTAGTGVTVAVLDTGLAAGGEDGIGCVVPGFDIVNNDSEPLDGDGHGTHVSGTIAATTNNVIGVAGLAYGACIMAVKVLDDTGNGSFADIADGIFYAVDNGVDVINMSLGINARYGVMNDPVMDPALDYAYTNGVTVVCASGNDGSRKNVSYPAIYSTTIAVGATGYDNRVVRYSNKGIGLDLVAPGGDTSKDLNGDGYADGILQETYTDGSWGYYFFQGTSMASPHVAAVAALLMAYGTAVTPDDVYSSMTSTTLDLGEAGYDKASGWGLVQAYNALTGVSACVPTEEPLETSCSDGQDNDCDGAIDADDSDCQGGECDLGQVGDSCSSNGDCCSNKCKGKPGAMTCK